MGTKLFSSPSRPEIFGYCGDVTFPMQVLPKICEQVERLDLFDGRSSFVEKLHWVLKSIQSGFSEYPTQWRKQFQILYVSRVKDGSKATFHAALISTTSNGFLSLDILNIPTTSGLVEKVGSGRASIQNWYSQWQKSDVKRTSRAVFGAFCDSLESGSDPLSGGAPQLGGLYRTGPAKQFGVIWRGVTYHLGMRYSASQNLAGVEWRNSNFERCDPLTMLVVENAQRQPRPTNVGGN